MGNSQYSNSKGAIMIRCKQASYNPGDTVNGKVYLNLYEHYSLSHITLKLVGKEKYQYHYKVTKQEEGKTIEEFRVDKDEKIIYNNQFIIFASQKGHLSEGQYVFPFKFVIKDTLPATFFYKKQSEVPNKNNKATINYKIFCQVHGIMNDKDHKLKHKQKFQIRQHLKDNVKSEYKANKTDLVTCCFQKHGEAELKAIFEKDAYVPTENVRIFFALNNEQGNIGISQFYGTLKQELKFGRNVIQRILDKSTLKGIGPRQKIEGKDAMISLNIPIEMKDQPTINSKLIQNVYTLELVGQIDGFTCWGVCGSQPEVRIPIQIANAQQKEEEIQDGQELKFFQQYTSPQIQLPSVWNPQVYPMVNIAFSDSTFITNEQQQITNDINFNYQSYQVNYDYPPQVDVNMNMQNVNMNMQNVDMNVQMNMGNQNMQGNMNVQMNMGNQSMQGNMNVDQNLQMNIGNVEMNLNNQNMQMNMNQQNYDPNMNGNFNINLNMN